MKFPDVTGKHDIAADRLICLQAGSREREEPGSHQLLSGFRILLPLAA